METEASMKIRHQKEELESERSKASLLRGLMWILWITPISLVIGSVTAAVMGHLPAEAAAGISVSAMFLFGLAIGGLFEILGEIPTDVEYKHKIELKQLQYERQMDKDIKEMMNSVG